MTTITGPKFERAMGSRSGDEMTLANAWHTVWVGRETGSRFYVNSDGGHVLGTYSTLTKAVAAALDNLAKYADGRAD